MDLTEKTRKRGLEMSELNVEYVESIVKLGLIERKKSILLNIGAEALCSAEETYHWFREYERVEALIRDPKNLKQIAEQIVKASK
jgi:hypothetical protein